MKLRPTTRADAAALAFVVLGWILVSGCQSSRSTSSAYELSGQTGLPKVLVRAPDRESIQRVAEEYFQGRGYEEAEARHVYQQVFDRPINPGNASKALRVRITVGPSGEGLWSLSGESLRVESWRGDLESVHAVPSGYSQIYDFLIEIKSRVEAGAGSIRVSPDPGG